MTPSYDIGNAYNAYYPIFTGTNHGSQNNRDVNRDENRGDKTDKSELSK
jgi:hypothetical protein